MPEPAARETYRGRRPVLDTPDAAVLGAVFAEFCAF
jgi:hypothetical protein